jgi:hypothetical protein
MKNGLDMNEITHSWLMLEVTLVTTLMTTRMLYLIR